MVKDDRRRMNSVEFTFAPWNVLSIRSLSRQVQVCQGMYAFGMRHAVPVHMDLVQSIVRVLRISDRLTVCDLCEHELYIAVEANCSLVGMSGPVGTWVIGGWGIGIGSSGGDGEPIWAGNSPRNRQKLTTLPGFGRSGVDSL